MKPIHWILIGSIILVLQSLYLYKKGSLKRFSKKSIMIGFCVFLLGILLTNAIMFFILWKI